MALLAAEGVALGPKEAALRDKIAEAIATPLVSLKNTAYTSGATLPPRGRVICAVGEGARHRWCCRSAEAGLSCAILRIWEWSGLQATGPTCATARCRTSSSSDRRWICFSLDTDGDVLPQQKWRCGLGRAEPYKPLCDKRNTDAFYCASGSSRHASACCSAAASDARACRASASRVPTAHSSPGALSSPPSSTACKCSGATEAELQIALAFQQQPGRRASERARFRSVGAVTQRLTLPNDRHGIHQAAGTVRASTRELTSEHAPQS